MGVGSQTGPGIIDDELRAIVECLLTAHYSESEIVDYLEGPFGLSPEVAARAVQDAVGPRRASP